MNTLMEMIDDLIHEIHDGPEQLLDRLEQVETSGVGVDEGTPRITLRLNHPRELDDWATYLIDEQHISGVTKGLIECQHLGPRAKEDRCPPLLRLGRDRLRLAHLLTHLLQGGHLPTPQM